MIEGGQELGSSCRGLVDVVQGQGVIWFELK